MEANFLGEAEFILNNNGSIYHLALKPGDLAETILLVGDPGRVTMISKHFDRVEKKIQKREFITHTGWLGDKRLSVVSTGIGTDNIDIVINECDALFNIDFEERRVKEKKTHLNFIRLGTSGALADSLQIGDMLCTSFALGLDGLHLFYPAPESGDALSLHEAVLNHAICVLLPPQFYVVEADPLLADRLGKNMQKGITITSPGFYGPQGRTLRIPSRIKGFPELSSSFSWKGLQMTNFEMESSAIFLLSRLLDHSAASVNVIIAHRPQAAFSRDPGKAVEAMITQVLESLST